MTSARLRHDSDATHNRIRTFLPLVIINCSVRSRGTRVCCVSAENDDGHNGLALENWLSTGLPEHRYGPFVWSGPLRARSRVRPTARNPPGAFVARLTRNVRLSVVNVYIVIKTTSGSAKNTKTRSQRRYDTLTFRYFLPAACPQQAQQV